MTESKFFLRSRTAIFGLAALVWGASGVFICQRFSPSGVSANANTNGFLGLWAVCVFNLLAMAMILRDVLPLVAGTADALENRAARAIRAFSWGTLKLVCLGILFCILLRDHELSLMGKLLGAGTLVVVPLVGGLGAVRHE